MAWVPSKVITEQGGIVFSSTFPFKIFLKKELKQGQSQPIYSFAVAYHSELLKNTFANNVSYLSFEKQSITGLDTFVVIPDPSTKNVYVTLDMKVSNLTITSAKINQYQEGDSGLAPFSFSNGFDQNFAQVILGIIVNDTEFEAGTTGDNQTAYVIQKVFTDLIITNLVVNNLPVVTAVPFTGAPLN